MPECFWKWMFLEMTVFGNECFWKWMFLEMNVFGNECVWKWMFLEMNVFGNSYFTGSSYIFLSLEKNLHIKLTKVFINVFGLQYELLIRTFLQIYFPRVGRYFLYTNICIQSWIGQFFNYFLKTFSKTIILRVALHC